ncbi:Concanavalin A-like lectin/glucanase, subgroup [Artemisia annua]|uniref:Concanavalin A-like lectin/glucanase, subgroup n=1 Tax=Artemisia annua TaxID=35608 RepID=A0A2U1LGU5_ARTAN|nr:Concanavalin A-like lectin/glucanase, subgroup [Artemisia annua]
MEESSSSNSLMMGRVILAFDATKERNDEYEFKKVINEIISRGDILKRGDTIVVFGVLHKIAHPFGYQMQIEKMNIRAMEEEIKSKLDSYAKMLKRSAEDCKEEGVDIEVKITCGTPIKKIIQQEASACNATWVVLDRYLKKDVKFFQGQIHSNLAIVLDELKIQPVPTEPTTDTDNTEIKVILYRSKHIQLSALQHNVDQPNNPTENVDSSKQDLSVTRRKTSFRTPVLCNACGMTTQMYIKESMKINHSQIQLATNNFSEANLLGEGGYGLVYKGQLSDGQIIAAKVRKQASTQGFEEFNSEIYVLSFARHRNIVMLLGYCCMENVNILVYEYICNRSLEWHLFDEAANVLEWRQRRAIAIGTAKGLRFLHEECRSSPIIHRDLRPSNILLTHDFVPMLGDFGLAKWKTNGSPIQTRILGTLGYLAPEYAENGMVSVRTDVYAYGITLIQLISGRKVVSPNIEDHHQSLRQWAEPLVESLALHDLIDRRLNDAYDPYELYQMAKTAYLCVKLDPDKRPSMGEVVQLLEGETDHFKTLIDQFIPHFHA